MMRTGLCCGYIGGTVHRLHLGRVQQVDDLSYSSYQIELARPMSPAYGSSVCRATRLSSITTTDGTSVSALAPVGHFLTLTFVNDRSGDEQFVPMPALKIFEA